MKIIVPDGTDNQDGGATVIPFPQGCQEYLGKEWGNCPARATVEHDGHAFCDYHHEQRANYYARPVWGRA